VKFSFFNTYYNLFAVGVNDEKFRLYARKMKGEYEIGRGFCDILQCHADSSGCNMTELVRELNTSRIENKGVRNKTKIRTSF